MGAEGAEEPGLHLIELARDDVRHALPGVSQAVEQEEVMDQRRRIAKPGADEDDAAADGPEGMQVGARDEHRQGEDGANGQRPGPLGNALRAAVRGVEAEDVGHRREHHRRQHDVRPVGGDGWVEIRSKTDQDAAKGRDIKED